MRRVLLLTVLLLFVSSPFASAQELPGQHYTNTVTGQVKLSSEPLVDLTCGIPGTFYVHAPTKSIYYCGVDDVYYLLAVNGGSITSFSAGALNPLFTTAVALATTTPALSFSLNSVAGNTLFGNLSAGPGTPSFNVITPCGDSSHALGFVSGSGFTCQAVAGGFAGFSSATVTPSTTPVFDASKTFNNLTLGQNVTSSTATGATANSLFGVNVCQNGTGNFLLTTIAAGTSGWPASFPQGPNVPVYPNTCLNALFWNNAGNFTLAAEPHTGAAAIRWVTNNGVDTNDGLSLATAKATVGAAYDSLPGTVGVGGVIYVDASSLTNGGGVSMDATSGGHQGLWVCGGNDPLCTGTLPTGWRFQKNGGVKIIGIGQASTPSNATGGGMATVYGCSTTDTTKPVLWLSGLSQPFYVENIDLGHASCAQPVKLSISMAGSRSSNSGAVNVYLKNVSATASRASASYGPGIDIGSNLVWLWMERIACDGNTTAAVDTDQRACIVSNPGASPASGPFYLRDSTFNGAGGVKIYNGGSGLSYFVENVMMESDGVKACPPTLWILNGTQFTFGQSKNIQHADCPVSTVYPAVEIDGNPPASNNLVEFAFGTNGFHVSGQATVFNTPYRASTATPEAQNQIAWWDDSSSDGVNGRIAAQQDSARRAFGPVGVSYTNLAATFPASWTIINGTVTPGITAPNGTTNAGTITYSGGCDVRPYQNASFSTNVGDWFVGGVWARASSAWTTGAAAMSVGMGVGTFTNGQKNIRGNTPITITSGGGEWEWISTSGKVAVGQVNQVVDMALVCENTRPVQYYGPVLLYFPAGTISANEVAALREHLQSYPTTASVKDVTTLPGTRFSMGVPNSNFFAKFTDATFSADRTFTLPNASGTLCLTTSCLTTAVTSVTFTGDGVILSSTPSAAVTTTGTVTATLVSAGAHKVLGNFTGSTAAPTYDFLTTSELPFTYTGSTLKLATSTGATVSGDCASWDASGNIVDSGVPNCTGGGGGGGGSVTSVGLVAPTGFTVSGSPVTGAGSLTLGMPASWNTGDLLLGNGSNSVARLAIGSSGRYLISNGTTASWSTTGAANPALSNLASVAINTSLLPASAASANLGTALLPFGNLFVGTAASKSASFNTSALTVDRILTIPDSSGTIAELNIANVFTATQTATNFALVAGGTIFSADTGTPTITFSPSAVSISGSGSPVDFVSISAYTPGSPPSVPIAAAGADTDIDLNLSSKGTGTVRANRLSVGTADQTLVSSAGLATKYQGVALGGNGVSTILYANDFAARTTSVGATTAFTTPASGAYSTGLFVLHADIVCTTGQATTTVGLTVTWNNGSAAQSATIIPNASSCVTTGNEFSSVPFTFYSAASQVISFSTTAANFTTGAYATHVRLEAK